MNNTRDYNRTAAFLLSLIFLVAQSFVWADTKKKDVDMDGSWSEGHRSWGFPCPVQAFYDATFIYIETTSDRSEIVIRISDADGELVYEGIMPQGIYSQLIPLDEFAEQGERYRLELSNQWGDLLWGEFQVSE